MRLRLRNVFLVYFAVSLVGLFCALRELGRPLSLPPPRAPAAPGPLRGGEGLPPIYVVTPTYARPVQKAELVRLSQTLLHVPALHWVVVEDAAAPSALVGGSWRPRGLLHAPERRDPPDLRGGPGAPSWLFPRGAEQRNRALRWLRDTRGRDEPAWCTSPTMTTPTACGSSRRCAAPAVSRSGPWVWWGGCAWSGRWSRGAAWWASTRAGGPSGRSRWTWPASPWRCGCCSPTPRARFDPRAERGFLESSFLGGLVTPGQLEPRADNCTQVLVWHTRTEKPKLRQEEQLQRQGRGSDPDIEV
ncbi:unnamed protein product [Coccothraustes coccothraustes]